jgi:hypothetical protein
VLSVWTFAAGLVVWLLDAAAEAEGTLITCSNLNNPKGETKSVNQFL